MLSFLDHCKNFHLIPFFIFVLFAIYAFPGLGEFDIFESYLQATSRSFNNYRSAPLGIFWAGIMSVGLTHFGFLFWLQNILFGIGFSGALCLLNYRRLGSVLSMLLLLLCPYLTFFFYRLTRDSLVAASFLSTCMLLALAKETVNELRKLFLQLAALSLLLFACIVRIDAVVPSMSILLLLIERYDKQTIARYLSACLAFGIVVICVHKLPLLHRDVHSTNAMLQTYKLDIVGMGVLAGKSFFPTEIQTTCSAPIESASKQFRESFTFTQKALGAETDPCVRDIPWGDIWKDVVPSNPLLYLRHRLIWGMVLLKVYKSDGDNRPNKTLINRKGMGNVALLRRLEHRARQGKDQYVTPVIDTPSAPPNLIVRYERWVQNYHHLFLFSGYWYAVMHLLVLFVSIKIRFQHSSLVISLSLSGISYLAVFALFAPADNFRYILWFALSAWLAFWFLLFSLLRNAVRESAPVESSFL